MVIKGLYSTIDEVLYNPFPTVAISKLLEMISRVHLYPRKRNCDRSPLANKPDCWLKWSSEHVTKLMHACHSVSVACRPAETCQLAMGKFIGQLSWVKYDPIVEIRLMS